MDIPKLAISVGVMVVGVCFLIFNKRLALFLYNNEPPSVRFFTFLNERERVLAVGGFFTAAGLIGTLAVLFDWS